MSKKDETIEILISKAIAMGKDDNKITMACMSNYPDVPAAEVIKLIAKGRKAAGKAPAPATPPARKPKAEAAPTPKKEKNARPQTPDAEHPWAGYTAMMKDCVEKGMEPENACKKMTKLYVKMTNGSFASDWKKVTGTKVTVTSAKPAGKPAATASVPPPKKPAKPAAAPKALPARKPKAAPAQQAQAAQAEEGVPEQGEEVPA